MEIDRMGRKRHGHQESHSLLGSAPSSSGISRRTVLRGAGLLGLGLTVGNWASLTEARALRPPGSLPHPRLPEGTDTIPEIEHVIILMMENHSFDNYLG